MSSQPPGWRKQLPSYREVRFGKDWLNALTPQFDNTTGWNSLSYTLTELKLDNSTGAIVESNMPWWLLGAVVQSVVSTTVVDGMSRSGMDRTKFVHLPHAINTFQRHTPTRGQELDDLLQGNFVLDLVPPSKSNSSDKLALHWGITVTGLGYRAEGVSYYLALALLFTHSAIAIVHIIWVLYTRNTSTAWSSLQDLVALVSKSTPPDSVLDGTSAGIESYETFKHPVRIRAAKPRPATGRSASSGLEIVFDADYVPDDFNTVAEGQLY